MYLTCVLSQEATGGCASLEQESKPRKRKTWDTGHTVCSTEKCKEILTEVEGNSQEDSCATSQEVNRPDTNGKTESSRKDVSTGKTNNNKTKQNVNDYLLCVILLRGVFQVCQIKLGNYWSVVYKKN